MIRFSSKPILVPVDFSTHSEAALVWAIGVAEKAGAPLVVLHVVHDPAENPGFYLKFLNQPEDPEGFALQPIEETAEKAMEVFLERFAEAHPDVAIFEELQTRLVVGVPATRILEVAEELDASQIVMGSQGRTGLDHWMIGSKAEQVVRLSPVPVTVVKLPPEEEAS